MTTDSHVYDILAELAPQASSYLCIGVQEGECLRHVLKANPKMERLVLCDTWGPHHGGTNRGNHDHILPIVGDTPTMFLDGPSETMIPKVIDPVDLSYVDGDHSYAVALADLRNVWPRTTIAMVVHDTRFTEVLAAVLTFLKEIEPSKVFVSEGGTGTTVIYR